MVSQHQYLEHYLPVYFLFHLYLLVENSTAFLNSTFMLLLQASPSVTAMFVNDIVP